VAPEAGCCGGCLRVGRNSSLCRDKNFNFSISSRPALGPTQPPMQWVPGDIFPWGKAATSAGTTLPFIMLVHWTVIIWERALRRHLQNLQSKESNGENIGSSSCSECRIRSSGCTACPYQFAAHASSIRLSGLRDSSLSPATVWFWYNEFI
jgi:hypothetical protein